MEATLENKCTVSVCVFKTTIMQGAEKMYQALLSSPATSKKPSKGKGKGIRARDHARGRREEGNACKEAIVFAIPPTNLKNNKNNATVND